MSIIYNDALINIHQHIFKKNFEYKIIIYNNMKLYYFIRKFLITVII